MTASRQKRKCMSTSAAFASKKNKMLYIKNDPNPIQIGAFSPAYFKQQYIHSLRRETYTIQPPTHNTFPSKGTLNPTWLTTDYSPVWHCKSAQSCSPCCPTEQSGLGCSQSKTAQTATTCKQSNMHSFLYSIEQWSFSLWFFLEQFPHSPCPAQLACT